MGNVLPFSSVQAAELASDPERKREATAHARCILLLGVALQRRVADDGTTIFAVGMKRFATLSDVEDFLDAIVGDDE